MVREGEGNIEQLEDECFGAMKRLLDAIAKSNNRGNADLLRISKRYGLDLSFVERVNENLDPDREFHFHPAIANFESYSEKQGKRPEPRNDVLDLANNENPLGPSLAVLKALRDGLDRIGRYPPLSDLQLRQHLVATLKAPGLGEDCLVLGRGVNQLISEIAFSFLVEGGHVVIFDHSFPVYREMAERSSCGVIPVPVHEDHSYDVEALCQTFERRPRIVFLGSPSNPTGVVLEHAEFSHILEHLPSNTLLVLDECYRDFAIEGTSLPRTFEAIAAGHNVISLRSFSKAHGLAGLRSGYAVACPEIARYLEKRREPYHVSQLVILACHAALDDSEHVRASVELVRRGRSELAAGLEALGFKVWKSHGNFLLFQTPSDKLDRDRAQVAKEITRRLESGHGVKIRDLGGGFTMPGHLRVTVGLPQENLRFLSAIKHVLDELDLSVPTKPAAPGLQSS
jgi:histidinol-phosphate aminotransferase